MNQRKPFVLAALLSTCPGVDQQIGRGPVLDLALSIGWDVGVISASDTHKMGLILIFSTFFLTTFSFFCSKNCGGIIINPGPH